MIIGDAIVIWRAWAFYQGTPFRKLVYVPIALLVACFAFALVTVNSLVVSSMSGKKLTSFGSKSSVGLRAWGHHSRYLRLAGVDSGNYPTQRIILVLIKPGFVYCFFWLSELHLFYGYNYADPNFITFFHAVFNRSRRPNLHALCPTIIIILFNTPCSPHDDLSALSVSTPSARMSTLLFASLREYGFLKLNSASFQVPIHYDNKPRPNVNDPPSKRCQFQNQRKVDSQPLLTLFITLSRFTGLPQILKIPSDLKVFPNDLSHSQAKPILAKLEAEARQVTRCSSLSRSRDLGQEDETGIVPAATFKEAELPYSRN
ncbi:hypothetical protein PM082_007526 [Marasmius tenuissimus]|nr:hypothetical protein PM082_007526 [Marasmius tenuissimus]